MASIFDGLSLEAGTKVRAQLYRRDRRERIATACMTGMLATGIKGTATDYAVLAVNFADALIAELDKEVKP